MNRRGFTLTELAIVIAAVGLFAVMSTGALLPIAMKNKADKLLNELSLAKNAVENFVRLNSRLPTEEEFPTLAVFDNETALTYRVNPNIRDFKYPELYLAYKPDEEEASAKNLDDNTSDLAATLPREAEAEYGKRAAYAYYIDAVFKRGEGDKKYRLRHLGNYYGFIELLGRQPLSAVQFLTFSLKPAKRGFPYTTTIHWRGGVMKYDTAAGEYRRSFDVSVGILGPEASKCYGTAANSAAFLCYRARPRALGIDSYNTFSALAKQFIDSGRPHYFNMRRNDNGVTVSGSTKPTGAAGSLYSWPARVKGRSDPEALPSPQQWTTITTYTPTETVFEVGTVTQAGEGRTGLIPRYGRFDTDPANPQNNPDNELRYVGENFDIVLFVRDRYAPDYPHRVYQKRLRVTLDPLR